MCISIAEVLSLCELVDKEDISWYGLIMSIYFEMEVTHEITLCSLYREASWMYY